MWDIFEFEFLVIDFGLDCEIYLIFFFRNKVRSKVLILCLVNLNNI